MMKLIMFETLVVIIQRTFHKNLWSKLYLSIYIMYIPTFVYIFTNHVITYKLTPAESAAALCEIIRLLMKTHAFIRSNAPAVLQFKPHTETKPPIPEFSKFLYFLFIPTLIYKDSYPRTKSIRWNYVTKCFIEVFGCIFYISFVVERFLIPEFREFGNGMAGVLILLNTFYLVLHSWMNGFAEMLKFGDRMFYKDWWTSSTYARYYRTWNVVVHDWLFTYIYKDMYEYVVPKNKILSKVMVFFVSAVVHEYILGFAFRFCFPVLFVEFFGLGVAVSFLKSNHKAIGNALVWYGLALGMGIGVSMYTMEFYARLNCPVEYSGIIGYFIPRCLTCKV